MLNKKKYNLYINLQSKETLKKMSEVNKKIKFFILNIFIYSPIYLKYNLIFFLLL